MGDEEQDGVERSFSWNRRRVLTATTLGITGLAGCGGSDDSGEDEDDDAADETTELNGSSPPDDSGGAYGDDGSGGSSGDIPVNECPMITGSYNTFESERGPLPYSFEYPAIIDEGENPMAYADREGQTIVNGQYFRNDLPGEGDLYMNANINLNEVVNRERWYDERSDRATLLTTRINGTDVTFVGDVPDMSYDEDRTNYGAVGLAPYTWDSTDESTTRRGESYHEVVIGVLHALEDDKTIAPSCAENLRTVLRNAVESIEMQDSVYRFEERV